MQSREGSFDGEDGHSQELSPRNLSPEQLKGRIEALKGELALSVARGEGQADAKQAVLEQTELRARLKQVEEDLGAAMGREGHLEAARLQAELAPLREQERLLSELVEARANVKRLLSVEARANAKNELHKAMFAVADELGGAYSQLRDPSGDVRFEAKDLIFGQPAQAARGVAHYLCVRDAELRKGMILGLQAIREEVARNGTETDKECLAYVLDMEAGSSGKAFQGGLKRDCDKDGCVLPSRLTAEGRGMRLSDFVAHKDAHEAGLSEAHVAALRFYTTAAFATINNGLRDQESEPSDPFPAPTADIRFSSSRPPNIRHLGSLQGRAGASAAGHGGLHQRGPRLSARRSGKPEQGKHARHSLPWHEEHDGVQDNFLQQGRGGTELAPMSTTRSLKDSLLLRIDTRNFMVRGPEISFLSTFPEEEEYLFPPLTYLEPTPGGVQTLRVDDATFTVIDVQAQPS